MIAGSSAAETRLDALHENVAQAAIEADHVSLMLAIEERDAEGFAVVSAASDALHAWARILERQL